MDDERHPLSLRKLHNENRFNWLEKFLLGGWNPFQNGLRGYRDMNFIPQYWYANAICGRPKLADDVISGHDVKTVRANFIEVAT